MNSRIVAVCLFLVLMIGAIVAVGKPITRSTLEHVSLPNASVTQQPCQSKRGIHIGVSLRNEDAPFYQDIEKGMREQAHILGYCLVFSDGSPDKKIAIGAPANLVKQSDKIRRFVEGEFIGKKFVDSMSAIIMAPDVPADAAKGFLDRGLAEAARKKIPIFTVDTDLFTNVAKAKYYNIKSYIASNNKDGGEQAGALMCQTLSAHVQGEAQEVVVILDTDPSASSVRSRVSGFREEMRRDCPTVSIEHKNVTVGGVGDDRAQSAAALAEMFQSIKSIHGVFAVNDGAAIGASKAIDDDQGFGRITLIGYDATPEGREAIEAGKLYADIAQDPERIGVAVLQAVAVSWKNESRPHLSMNLMPTPVPACVVHQHSMSPF